MKLAICNETFQDWPFDKAFQYARDLGYTGIEIAPFTMNNNAYDISPDERAKVRSQVEAAGLEMIGLHWLLAFTEGYYLTSPDETVRKKTAEYLSELARLCRDLGGRVLVLGSPKQRNLEPIGISHEEGMQHAADCIGRALPAFEETGTVLAIEPLGPEEGDFLNKTEQGIELIKMIDAPCVRLHLDVKAMSSEERLIPDIIRASAPYVVHFHANDANRRGPGMGAINFVPILAALREIDYQGWVSVEVFDYEPGVETLASESIRYLQQCLEKI